MYLCLHARVLLLLNTGSEKMVTTSKSCNKIVLNDVNDDTKREFSEVIRTVTTALWRFLFVWQNQPVGRCGSSTSPLWIAFSRFVSPSVTPQAGFQNPPCALGHQKVLVCPVGRVRPPAEFLSDQCMESVAAQSFSCITVFLCVLSLVFKCSN